jgi:internalin A
MIYRPRIRLRWFLAVVLLLSLWMARLAVHAHSTRAVAGALRTLGARYSLSPQNGYITNIVYPYTAHIDPFLIAEIVEVDAGSPETAKEVIGLLPSLTELRTLKLIGGNVSDADLRAVAGLRKLELLELASSRITDQGVPHLVNLKNLYYLGLSGAKITDGGLGYLRKLSNLRDLDLSHTDVGQTGLKNIAAIPTITTLYLADTKLSDSDLADVSEMGCLAGLDLAFTDVSDEGILHLRTLPRLSWLVLDGVQKVTTHGVAALRQRKPSLKVFRHK